MLVSQFSAQRTLNHAIGCVGVGWHTRASVALTLHPAGPGTGIRFRRGDGGVPVAAVVAEASEEMGGLVLGGRTGGRILSAAHLLTALAVCRIDNVLVEMSGPEIPAMDGSAASFVALIEGVGVIERGPPRPIVEVVAPVQIADGSAVARLEPATAPGLDVTIDLPETPIGRQRLTRPVDPDLWRQDATARHVVLHDRLAEMRKRGHARGASAANTVVAERDRLEARDGPRFADEAARHALADALADLLLLGQPLKARYVGVRGDHGLHARLLRRLLADPDAWQVRHEEGSVVPGRAWRPAAGPSRAVWG